MCCTEGSPNGVGRIADAVPLDQFPSHRREHVVVFIDALQSLAGELSLHRECHEQLLPHQAETGSLHGPFAAKKLHTHRPSLSDPPRPAARLAQSVQ